MQNEPEAVQESQPYLNCHKLSLVQWIHNEAINIFVRDQKDFAAVTLPPNNSPLKALIDPSRLCNLLSRTMLCNLWLRTSSLSPNQNQDNFSRQQTFLGFAKLVFQLASMKREKSPFFTLSEKISADSAELASVKSSGLRTLQVASKTFVGESIKTRTLCK